MMIDLKPKITQALRANEALVLLLDGPKVYPETAPDKTQYPYITYFEITNYDGQHADDVPIDSKIHFHFDIFSKGNTFPIAKEVDATMKSLGFSRSGTADQYDNETKTYHKILRYRTTIYGEVL